MSREIHFFFDETGSRHLKQSYSAGRTDRMDCFGFGGVMILEEDIDKALHAHRVFCDKWQIDYPLHSHEIRGGRGNFSWLKNPERAMEFLPALDEFLVSLPVTGIAAVIHRPGYVKRYSERYAGQTWLMDKTAFSILIERATKYTRSKGRKLRVFFEESGKREDRDIVNFMKALKTEGMPFDRKAMENYCGLKASEFREFICGEPKRKSKRMPMLQMADLYLYPMAKGGYDPDYRPYKTLLEAGRIIDAGLEPQDIAMLGVKYSCFDDV